VAGLVVFVIIFDVEKHLSHSHGFVVRIGDVLVLGVGQIDQDLCCVLGMDAGRRFNGGQQQGFVDLFCGYKTGNMRPGSSFCFRLIIEKKSTPYYDP